MDERKQAILDWLEKLEQYARGNTLPVRIVDGIQYCKEKIADDSIEPDKLQTEIEGLLDSIRRKIEPEGGGNTTDSSIAAQEVAKQLQKMAERCHTDNERAIQDISEHKNLVLSKCEEQLKDILCTDAHLEEMLHETRYIRFYEKAANDLEQELADMLSALMERMDENYTGMLKHMRSLFGSLRESGNGTIRERALYELDAKREGIRGKVLAEAGTWKTGRQELVSFAKRTWSKINKIVKATEIKRKLYAALPVLLVLALLVGNGVLRGMEASYELKKAELEMTAATEQEKEPLLEQLSNAMELGEEVLNVTQQGKEVVETLGSVNSLLIGIVGILLVLLLYRAYLKWLRGYGNRSIAKKCAEYLQVELGDLEQSHCLRMALDEGVRLAVEEYEQQHVRLFHEVFTSEDGGTEAERKRGFEELITLWNGIR